MPALLTDQGVSPAVITPNNQTVADNQSVALSNIFSVSGNGITQYKVWFSHPEGGNPALGTVTNNGTPIALDQPVTVTSLSGLSYTGSATPGTDIVFLQAYDGVWSGWMPALLTDQGVTPAVITPNNQTVADNQSVALSNIFSVSGNGITQYKVWFSHPEGGNPALGTVTNNGTPIALDQPVTVTSLSGLSYTGSATPGTDIVFLQAYDGVWSGWMPALLTDQGVSPAVITPNNQTVADNQSVALSNIFSVSGNGITQYKVWFSHPEGGNPALGTVTNNGTPIALDQPVTVTSLSGLSYTGSATPGTDVVFLQAYDGVWSGWMPALLTDQGVSPAVITPNNQTVVGNQSVPLANIFSVSGTGISQFQVWFSHPEGGNPALGTVTNNGTPIALDQPVTVTSLSGLSYTGSATPGTDIVFLKAYDGVWSGWTPALLTDTPPAIAPGATLELASAYSGTLSFAAPTGMLKIDNSASFSGKIAGQLAIEDVIDLTDITAGASATIGYSGNNSPGTLTVSDGTHTASIALLGNYSLANFTALSDGHGGTSVIDPPIVLAQDPVGGLSQQMALLSQSLASFAPSDGAGSGRSDAPLAYNSSQLANLGLPVPSQHHA